MKVPTLRFSAAAVAALLLLALVWAARRQEPAAPPLPNPNGYDDLLAAVPLLVPNAGNWRTQDVAELRTILAQNSNALNRIRPALAKEWRVPVTFDTNYILRFFFQRGSRKIPCWTTCDRGTAG